MTRTLRPRLKDQQAVWLGVLARFHSVNRGNGDQPHLQDTS
ncbi:MAG: hypothetical protein ACKO4L_05250 [Nodosilinea sp.]